MVELGHDDTLSHGHERDGKELQRGESYCLGTESMPQNYSLLKVGGNQS